MKKLLKIILLFSFVIISFGDSCSQIPSYALTVKNPFLSNGNKKLTFGIYLKNTSTHPIELVGAQYYFRLPFTFGSLGIGTGNNSGYQFDSAGGTHISEVHQGCMPKNPSIDTVLIDGVKYYQLILRANSIWCNLVIPPNIEYLVIGMKLISNSPFNLSNLNLLFRDSCNDNPVPVTRTKVNFYIGTNNVEVTRCLNHFVDFQPPVYLNVKLAIEGLYSPVLNRHNKNDNVTVSLRETISPYQIIDSSNAVIDSNTLSGDFTFLKALTPKKYYLVIKYKNGLETWSRNGGDTLLQGNNTYDFTDSSLKAYGNNILLKGSKYCLYSGDVNYDNSVDITDLTLIDNDAFNLSQGSLITDLDGNYITDLTDLAIADNNVLNYISVIRP